MPFVESFAEVGANKIPRVATTLSRRDHLGTIGARTGVTRNCYSITPGLYCTGTPSNTSPVLVTANYKLSFDSLRTQLAGIDAFILVIDTRGINVWCAAGKGTFSAEEIAYQVQQARLSEVVTHRELILPQLSANGVALHKLKNLCGFRGKLGPIKAADIPAYLQTGKASEKMRTVTFSFYERLTLIPLEVCMLWKQFLAVSLAIFLISGFSPEIYSLAQAGSRALIGIWCTVVAILSGSVLTPILLGWIPFRQFWLKGALLGLLAGALYLLLNQLQLSVAESFAAMFWITACSSFLAMNFTGSTVFTSLSGVKVEMRKGLSFQLISTGLALICWLAAPFLN